MNTIETHAISEPRIARGFIPAIIHDGKTCAVHFSWLQRGKPVVFTSASYDALSACNVFSNPLGAVRASERAADLYEGAKPIVLENNHPDAV